MNRLTGLIIKYKLYHIPFWLGYHLIWLTINIGSLSKAHQYLFFSLASVKFYSYVVFQIIAVYFNLYYLIPKLLNTGRYKTYLVSVLLVTFLCTACISGGYYLAAFLSSKSFEDSYGIQPSQFWTVFCVWVLPSTLGAMTLAMSIKLGKNWLEAEKRRHRLETEKLETELKYLKAQINPHFLFNTINSIFALIPRNPVLASESLATFSSMLRYQLYECNDTMIDFDKELEFISNFIDLEKLRLDANSTQMHFEIQNEARSGQMIAPFILIPFIENAFKHVSKGKGNANFIQLDLIADTEGLTLNIVNSVKKVPVLSDTTVHSGIGLTNVKRRLNLMYPENHALDIEELEESFTVKLKMIW